eukprot:CAMPEP_0171267998 /NCGR_PEP_ID=MMETSP0790-20130122/59443_1 /TAXON_ID=2925 /ORGANISM="Alexandrium catenella, Strain OF101" /LENGTH=39 /DNA_ID= /DNA_START= /DNA_END= /DNA_ORIENTATION=
MDKLFRPPAAILHQARQLIQRSRLRLEDEGWPPFSATCL